VSASGEGGAIYFSGELRVEGTLLVHNTAGGSGGAIRGFGILSIADSTFLGNSAPNGGALYLSDTAEGSAATVRQTLFSGNSASGNGGAIYLDGGTLDLANCGGKHRHTRRGPVLRAGRCRRGRADRLHRHGVQPPGRPVRDRPGSPEHE
jgi:predicted outer membrane repeat protein